LNKTIIKDRVFDWGSKTYIMGIINITPDSFSGDGELDLHLAVDQAKNFELLGADIIDVGGESTRPSSLYHDSKPVSIEQELTRVIPVIKAITKEIGLPVSIDTYKSQVALEALSAGASMINDVWGFKADFQMSSVVAHAGVPVVIMHNQKNTDYDDLVPDVISSLEKLKDEAINKGVNPGNIILDPGIGFGKTPEQNLQILRRLDEFTTLGQPILIGTSRKSTIGLVLNLPVGDRIEGTAATVALSIASGADIVRVHDVKEMIRVARMSDAIIRGWEQM